MRPSIWFYQSTTIFISNHGTLTFHDRAQQLPPFIYGASRHGACLNDKWKTTHCESDRPMRAKRIYRVVARVALALLCASILPTLSRSVLTEEIDTEELVLHPKISLLSGDIVPEDDGVGRMLLSASSVVTTSRVATRLAPGETPSVQLEFEVDAAAATSAGVAGFEIKASACDPPLSISPQEIGAHAPPCATNEVQDGGYCYERELNPGNGQCGVTASTPLSCGASTVLDAAAETACVRRYEAPPAARRSFDKANIPAHNAVPGRRLLSWSSTPSAPYVPQLITGSDWYSMRCGQLYAVLTLDECQNDVVAAWPGSTFVDKSGISSSMRPPGCSALVQSNGDVHISHNVDDWWGVVYGGNPDVQAQYLGGDAKIICKTTPTQIEWVDKYDYQEWKYTHEAIGSWPGGSRHTDALFDSAPFRAIIEPITGTTTRIMGGNVQCPDGYDNLVDQTICSSISDAMMSSGLNNRYGSTWYPFVQNDENAWSSQHSCVLEGNHVEYMVAGKWWYPVWSGANQICVLRSGQAPTPPPTQASASLAPTDAPTSMVVGQWNTPVNDGNGGVGYDNYDVSLGEFVVNSNTYTKHSVCQDPPGCNTIDTACPAGTEAITTSTECETALNGIGSTTMYGYNPGIEPTPMLWMDWWLEGYRGGAGQNTKYTPKCGIVATASSSRPFAIWNDLDSTQVNEFASQSWMDMSLSLVVCKESGAPPPPIE